MIKVVSQKSDAVIIHDDKSKKQQKDINNIYIYIYKDINKNKRQKLSMTNRGKDVFSIY